MLKILFYREILCILLEVEVTNEKTKESYVIQPIQFSWQKQCPCNETGLTWKICESFLDVEITNEKPKQS